MDSAINEPSKTISMSEFININKEKIDKVTLKTPSITKDDEWRDEDFWDDMYEKKANN